MPPAYMKKQNEMTLQLQLDYRTINKQMHCICITIHMLKFKEVSLLIHSNSETQF